jgi:hypothetical protein
MRKWLYERPWIWIVLFLSCLIAGSIATVIIAEVNKPEIVKPKAPRKARTDGATESRFRLDTGAASRHGAAGPAAAR